MYFFAFGRFQCRISPLVYEELPWLRQQRQAVKSCNGRQVRRGSEEGPLLGFFKHLPRTGYSFYSYVTLLAFHSNLWIPQFANYCYFGYCEGHLYTEPYLNIQRWCWSNCLKSNLPRCLCALETAVGAAGGRGAVAHLSWNTHRLGTVLFNYGNVALRRT